MRTISSRAPAIPTQISRLQDAARHNRARETPAVWADGQAFLRVALAVFINVGAIDDRWAGEFARNR